ncbi:divalent-cation tolerance protein CutA [Streptomyces orinoci]|uniref:Divalent-cation tolerance protein CutA n=1 Tax=Streptomyces orinoci TaxID=67339 RepID=A0ABV3K484_STRON|nr:divalent-cation tolerance protein CutA [Streptomyces orinoci]
MSEAIQYIAVTTTTDSEESARRLASAAIEQRLAACAQIDGPITSVYQWQRKIRTDTEWRLHYKTTRARYPELEAYLKAEHPYDVPEIIATEITTGSADYLAWVRRETRS